MNEVTPVILIVEDDKKTFIQMQKALQEEAEECCSKIKIMHASTLREAYQMCERQAFNIISSDMQFPLFANDQPLYNNGAELLAHLCYGNNPLNKKFILFYSTLTPQDLRDVLIEYGFNEDDIPLSILQKDSSVSHEAWTKEILSKVKTLQILH